ncbi:MAG: 2OG-Fe(II) oxygenase family protein [Gammaproteobacteria bacterium]|nr:2OG-Fe(II) oxygenase family protein [Gammaproteobacteria bacterium]
MALKDDSWLDESDVLSLFPTLVWRLQLAPDLSEQINGAIVDSLRVMNPGLTELAAGETWQSEHQLHELEAFCELLCCIERGAGMVLKFLKVGHDAVEVTGCWANVGARGASHAVHSHPNNFLSGVYYVQTSPGADTINFHDPRPQASVLRAPVTELTGQNMDQVVVNVASGTLLIFPSYLPHSVSPSASDGQRTSISFNIMFSSFTEKLSKPMWDARARSSED